MRINTNVSSLNAWRNLNGTDGNMTRNLERLSSGFRINRAADDAAGLAVSEKMRAQIRGINQAVRNAQDGISLVQTAEGALTEMHTMMQRMRELAVQSGNDTLQSEDRNQIQSEMDQLAREVTRITNATQFNAKDLINGAMKKADSDQFGGINDLTLQIGPNKGQNLTFSIDAMDATSLGIGRDVQTAIVFDKQGTESTSSASVSGDVVSSVDLTEGVGAGLAKGEYVVKYDNTNKTVQLFEANGTTAIGVQAAATNGGTVTIGDVNTGRTVELTLHATVTSLTAVTQDRLMVGSRVGAAKEIDANISVLNTTGSGTGVSEIGWGLSGGDYFVTVSVSGSNTFVQLLDSTGAAIGARATVADAGGVVEIGDKTTGRTMKVNVCAATTLSNNEWDTVKVVNNSQGAFEAQFYGGTKAKEANTWGGLNVMSAAAANEALVKIDDAINKVSYQRAQLGSIQNRLEHTVNNLQVVSENLSASESRIRDVDMALEMTQFSKNQILIQAGTAMLAQANAKTQNVLSLLR